MPRNGKNILKNGTIKYYKGNKLHNFSGPAIIYTNGKMEFWEFGEKLYFKELKNGFYRVYKREGNGDWTLRTFNSEGRLESINDKPAYFQYSKLSKSLNINWYLDGIPHRKNGSAIQYFYKDITCNINAKHKKFYKLQEIFIQHNKYHNYDGPAIIYYNSSDPYQIDKCRYCLHDKSVSKEEWTITNRERKLNKMLQSIL